MGRSASCRGTYTISRTRGWGGQREPVGPGGLVWSRKFGAHGRQESTQTAVQSAEPRTDLQAKANSIGMVDSCCFPIVCGPFDPYGNRTHFSNALQWLLSRGLPDFMEHLTIVDPYLPQLPVNKDQSRTRLTLHQVRPLIYKLDKKTFIVGIENVYKLAHY